MAKPSAFGKFLEDNTKGAVNKLFLGAIAVEVANSDNKVKQLIKSLTQFIFWKQFFAVSMVGAFGAMGKSIRSLVNDTGSLQAVLRKLTQIQGLQRIFGPLVGGAEAAKLKVAALVNFAATNNLNLDDVGAGAQSLQVLTHGAYSGVVALQSIGDTAAATGNGIKETSDAVGGFYADLRDGRPIAAASQRLREMGILSDADVGKLNALQQSGATNAAVFGQLTRSLEANKGAMKGLAGEIANVEAAHEAAKTNLQEKFASPFVESDVQNTKNMTEAMNAIAPTVGRVASFLEKLTNGFSTAYSAIAKTAAQSPILSAAFGNLVVVVSSLVAVVSAVAAISLASWLFSAAAGMVAFSGATAVATVAVRGLGVAMAATGIGLILAVVGTAVGTYLNFANASDEATRALNEQRKAHEEVDSAMRKQIDAATTLREKHEAMAKAIQNTKDAQKEYNEALREQAEADSGTWNSLKSNIGGLFGKDWGHDEAAAKKVAEAQRALIQTKNAERKAQVKVDPAATYMSAERAQGNIEVAKARATIAGNQESVVRLGNLESYAQNFERLRAQYGDDGARQKALFLTSGQIAEQGAAPTVSSLARLGLGGEVGGGTDVQKQIRDLTKDIAGYLRSIDAKVSSAGTPENTPQEYDGT